MFGIFLDVTQRKQAEEANELLAGVRTDLAVKVFGEEFVGFVNVQWREKHSALAGAS